MKNKRRKVVTDFFVVILFNILYGDVSYDKGQKRAKLRIFWQSAYLSDGIFTATFTKPLIISCTSGIFLAFVCLFTINLSQAVLFMIKPASLYLHIYKAG